MNEVYASSREGGWAVAADGCAADAAVSDAGASGGADDMRLHDVALTLPACGIGRRPLFQTSVPHLSFQAALTRHRHGTHMQFKDYYGILGVEPSAGEAEIKTAYRRLARKYHPDVSKEAGAEEKFKAVNEAYEALRDPQKRAAYDQLRTRGYRPGDEVHPPPGGFGQGGAEGFDFDEIFAGGGAGGGFSDFFEELFGRRRSAGGFSQHPGQGPGAHRAPPRGDTRATLG